MGSTKPFSFQNAESDSGIGFGGSSDAPSRAPNFDAGRAASQDFAQRYPGWRGLPSEGGRDGFGGAGGSYLGDAVGRGMTNDPDDVLQASTFLSDNGFLNGPQTEADETFFKGIEDGQKALNKANDGGIQIDGVVKPSGPTEITTQRGVTAGVFNANSSLKMKNDLLAKDGLAPPLNPSANKSAETRLQEGLAKRNPTQSEQMSTIRAHKEVKAKEDAAQQRANAASFQKEKSLADENREISERLARLNKRREARKTPAQKAMETLQKQNQAASKKVWNDMVQRAVASQKRRNIDPRTGRPRVDTKVDPAQQAKPAQPPQQGGTNLPDKQAMKTELEKFFGQSATPPSSKSTPQSGSKAAKSRIPDTPLTLDDQGNKIGPDGKPVAPEKLRDPDLKNAMAVPLPPPPVPGVANPTQIPPNAQPPEELKKAFENAPEVLKNSLGQAMQFFTGVNPFQTQDKDTKKQGNASFPADPKAGQDKLPPSERPEATPPIPPSQGNTIETPDRLTTPDQSDDAREGRIFDIDPIPEKDRRPVTEHRPEIAEDVLDQASAENRDALNDLLFKDGMTAGDSDDGATIDTGKSAKQIDKDMDRILNAMGFDKNTTSKIEGDNRKNRARFYKKSKNRFIDLHKSDLNGWTIEIRIPRTPNSTKKWKTVKLRYKGER